jgi:hypothetical protein
MNRQNSAHTALPRWLAQLSVRRSRRVLGAAAIGVICVSAALGSLFIVDESEPSPFGANGALTQSPPAAIAELRAAVENEAVESVASEAPSLPSPPPELRSATLEVVRGRIGRGGTIAASLQELNISPAMIHRISTAMRPVFDFRRAQASDRFALVRDDQGELRSFEFRRGRRDIYRIERDGEGAMTPSHAAVPVELRVVHLGGIIDKSLFQSLVDLGEGPHLVNELADIFAWDFDFSSQARPGDEFRMVFEKFYDRDGFVRYGMILAAQYRSAARDLTALYFEDDDGYGDYFTLDGNSVRRTFLRAPVKYSHISSRYTRSRLHPILKIRRPHYGIDYAAPSGTPVWAVADGVVEGIGWSGGFGRLIRVRHNNGYVSYYGHLSRFGAVERGSQVRQKQVIGYVGESGLATAPHLDYRLKTKGKFVDPLRVKFPKGEPISVSARDRFERVKDSRLAELNAAQPAVVLEAAM